jgi:ribonuclease P protein component
MERSRAQGRLTRRAEFDAVYRNGRRRSSRQFTVFFAANGLAESRFGMSVGRALGGAVVRNRIRRRVREILRLDRGEIPTGWDIIVHPRASVAKAEFASLGDELLGLVRNSLPPRPVPQSGEKNSGGSPASARPGTS